MNIKLCIYKCTWMDSKVGSNYIKTIFIFLSVNTILISFQMRITPSVTILFHLSTVNLQVWFEHQLQVRGLPSFKTWLEDITTFTYGNRIGPTLSNTLGNRMQLKKISGIVYIYFTLQCRSVNCVEEELCITDMTTV